MTWRVGIWGDDALRASSVALARRMDSGLRRNDGRVGGNDGGVGGNDGGVGGRLINDAGASILRGGGGEGDGGGHGALQFSGALALEPRQDGGGEADDSGELGDGGSDEGCGQDVEAAALLSEPRAHFGAYALP